MGQNSGLTTSLSRIGQPFMYMYIYIVYIYTIYILLYIYIYIYVIYIIYTYTIYTYIIETYTDIYGNKKNQSLLKSISSYDQQDSRFRVCNSNNNNNKNKDVTGNGSVHTCTLVSPSQTCGQNGWFWDLNLATPSLVSFWIVWVCLKVEYPTIPMVTSPFWWVYPWEVNLFG
jgi:hypothetical protein